MLSVAILVSALLRPARAPVARSARRSAGRAGHLRRRNSSARITAAVAEAVAQASPPGPRRPKQLVADLGKRPPAACGWPPPGSRLLPAARQRDAGIGQQLRSAARGGRRSAMKPQPFCWPGPGSGAGPSCPRPPAAGPPRAGRRRRPRRYARGKAARIAADLALSKGASTTSCQFGSADDPHRPAGRHARHLPGRLRRGLHRRSRA